MLTPPSPPSPLAEALRHLEIGHTLVWPSTNFERDRNQGVSNFKAWVGRQPHHPPVKLTTRTNRHANTITFTKLRTTEPRPPRRPTLHLRPFITLLPGEFLLLPATDNPNRELAHLRVQLERWRAKGGHQRKCEFVFTAQLALNHPQHILITRAPHP